MNLFLNRTVSGSVIDKSNKEPSCEGWILEKQFLKKNLRDLNLQDVRILVPATITQVTHVRPIGFPQPIKSRNIPIMEKSLHELILIAIGSMRFAVSGIKARNLLHFSR